MIFFTFSMEFSTHQLSAPIFNTKNRLSAPISLSLISPNFGSLRSQCKNFVNFVTTSGLSLAGSLPGDASWEGAWTGPGGAPLQGFSPAFIEHLSEHER
jgi:hypothetical protein